MAETLYLVTRSAGAHAAARINGVTAVLINNDSGQTTAQILAAATAQVNAGNLGGVTLEGPTIYPSSYFDTVTAVSDLTSGPLKDNNDCYVFGSIGGEAGVVKVEG